MVVANEHTAQHVYYTGVLLSTGWNLLNTDQHRETAYVQHNMFTEGPRQASDGPNSQPRIVRGTGDMVAM